MIIEPPTPVRVLDAAGRSVLVTERGLIPAAPAQLQIEDSPYRTSAIVTAWAGPWPVDERWWDPAAHRRLVRLQATTDQGAAYLLRLTGGRWWVEAIYD